MTKNVGDMTEAELASYYFEHRDELTGDEVEAVIAKPLDSVVSVRFRAGELSAVENAAKDAGMKFTAYIREAALNSAGVTDVSRARKDARKMRNLADAMLHHLGLPA